ncbi:MAG: PKD domain-containing protein, partial [Thermoplasmata archaeon]|nr:PKD domain-containing protein [Thermoplasmata archaeon]
EGAEPDNKVIEIPWGGNSNLTVTQQIPGNALPGVLYSQITLFYGQGKNLTIPLTVTVLEYHHLTISAPASVTPDPGTTGAVGIILHNTGNVDEEVTLNFTQIPGIGLELSRANNITIPAFGSAAVWMNITVPYQKEYAGKEFEIKLQAGNLSAVNIGVRVSLEYHEIHLEYRGFVKFEDGINYYLVRVKNNGTAEEIVLLKAAAPAGWDVSFSPGVVVVPPGSFTDISIEVRAPEAVPADSSPEIIVRADYLNCERNGIKETITIENSPPVAGFSVIPEKGRVVFNASASSDPDGEIVEYQWEIGGMNFSGPVVSYSFAEPGKYQVKLRVVDNLGKADEREETVTIKKENSLRALES